MSRRFVQFTSLLIALTVMLLSGCERAGPLEMENGQEPTLSSIQENIFNTSCALSQCHTGGNPPQGLNLSEGQSYSNLVNVSSNERPDLLRVDPGNPNQSYLLMKIEGAEGILGGRMPFGRPPLSKEQIDVVRQWIANGAQNN